MFKIKSFFLRLILAVFQFVFVLSTAQTLQVPAMVNEPPAANLRVKMTPKEYEGTDVYYSLFLPDNHDASLQYPVIVEYTGNKWDKENFSGEVKDANLGYAIAKQLGAIWIVLPYIKDKTSVTKWWGNELETIEFAIKTIKEVCKNYGGNHSEVFICGFSRGAIAVNYLGLHNDEIADVWLGFFSHDHYDGVKVWKGTKWGFPKEKYVSEAMQRLLRLKGRNALISQNVKKRDTTFLTKQYFKTHQLDTLGNISYNLIYTKDIIKDIDHPHTDKWLLYQSEYANTVYQWFKKTIATKPNTYSVCGSVKTISGEPLQNIMVGSGKTHFTYTNTQGDFCLKGLVGGKREMIFSTYEDHIVLATKTVDLQSNIEDLNMIID